MSLEKDIADVLNIARLKRYYDEKYRDEQRRLAEIESAQNPNSAGDSDDRARSGILQDVLCTEERLEIDLEVSPSPIPSNVQEAVNMTTAIITEPVNSSYEAPMDYSSDESLHEDQFDMVLRITPSPTVSDIQETVGTTTAIKTEPVNSRYAAPMDSTTISVSSDESDEDQFDMVLRVTPSPTVSDYQENMSTDDEVQEAHGPTTAPKIEPIISIAPKSKGANRSDALAGMNDSSDEDRLVVDLTVTPPPTAAAPTSPEYYSNAEEDDSERITRVVTVSRIVNQAFMFNGVAQQVEYEVRQTYNMLFNVTFNVVEQLLPGDTQIVPILMAPGDAHEPSEDDDDDEVNSNASFEVIELPVAGSNDEEDLPEMVNPLADSE